VSLGHFSGRGEKRQGRPDSCFMERTCEREIRKGRGITYSSRVNLLKVIYSRGVPGFEGQQLGRVEELNGRGQVALVRISRLFFLIFLVRFPTVGHPIVPSS